VEESNIFDDNIAPEDAVLIFKPDSLIVLLPRDQMNDGSDEVPYHILLASAFGAAATIEQWKEVVIEWFVREANENKNDNNYRDTGMPNMSIN